MEDAYKVEPSVREKLSDNYMKPVELLFWSFFLAMNKLTLEPLNFMVQVTAW
jgi:hypothetical protein